MVLGEHPGECVQAALDLVPVSLTILPGESPVGHVPSHAASQSVGWLAGHTSGVANAHRGTAFPGLASRQTGALCYIVLTNSNNMQVSALLPDLRYWTVSLESWDGTLIGWCR
ncbi:hypothetical protein GCM10010452_62090 [Crossiella cryophila]